jgi:LPXTG-motif cell wall-anchored protein
MKKFILLLAVTTAIQTGRASAHSDSIVVGWDSLDKLHKNLTEQSQDLKSKIDAAEKKINEAKAAKEHKTNYWIPIAGGAVLGIALALWLRRRKKG